MSPKKIILLSDGTGNSSGSVNKTNVWRTYQALDTSPASEQIAFYDNGVGTSSFRPKALLGMAFGWGLARNVRTLYGHLCRSYNPGDDNTPPDQIYGFGFSRGAYTIRVLMGFIADQGIIDRSKVKDERDMERFIIAAYRRFRQNRYKSSLLLSLLKIPRLMRDSVVNIITERRGREIYNPEKHCLAYSKDKDEDRDKLIKFVGVWDTVDAYGTPIDELTDAWDAIVWPLKAKDRECSNRIEKACHALALDEQRQSFLPTLWNEENTPPAANTNTEHVTQVWFAGVHANIGGGYPDDALAYIALNWMIIQAKKAGLKFKQKEEAELASKANFNGPANDSRAGLGQLYRFAPRHLDLLTQHSNMGIIDRLFKKTDRKSEPDKVKIIQPKIHQSVFERTKSGRDGYAPLGLPADYVVVDDSGDITKLGENNPLTTIESPDQARIRRIKQANAWNKVWYLKVLYYITLILVICWICYPWWSGESNKFVGGMVEQFFGTFSNALRSIPQLISYLPGLSFLRSWSDAYEAHPYIFSLLLIVVGLFLLWARYLKASLDSEMRIYWKHIWHSSAGDSKKPPKKNWFANFLDSYIVKHEDSQVDLNNSPAQQLINSWVKPMVSILAMLFLSMVLILPIANRAAILVLDGFGYFCTTTVKPVDQLFSAKNTCFDTAYAIKKGKRYQIKLTINSDEWRDASIRSDIAGWIYNTDKSASNPPDGLKNPTPWLSFSLPFRRHLFVGWFEPVARIDDSAFAQFALTHNPEIKHSDEDCHQFNGRGERTSLCKEFTAMRTGNLFVYLNEPVFFHPSISKYFYENNFGSALVEVAELSE